MSSRLGRAFEQAEAAVLVKARRTDSGILSQDLATAAGGSMANALAGAATNRAIEQYGAFRNRVYSAVRPIACSIAGQQVMVAKRGRSKQAKPRRASKEHLPRCFKKLADNLEVLEEHPLLAALARPNSVMVQWSLLFVTAASLELTGRYYWWIIKSTDEGREGEFDIWPLPTSWVTPDHTDGFYAHYLVRVPGAVTPHRLPGTEVKAFYYPDPSDPFGALAPLQAAAGPITCDEAIITSQISGFRNGLHPGLAIIAGDIKDPGMPGQDRRAEFTDVQKRQLINTIKAYYRGVLKHGEPLILDALIKDVKPVSTSPKEMDWKDSSECMGDRIFQTFGTNPIIAGRVEGVNRASAVAAEGIFDQFTVNPKIELLSQILTTQIAPIFAPDEDLVVWIEPCHPDDPDTKRADADLLVRAKAITRDELRGMYGMEPLPGDAGRTIVCTMADVFMPEDETGDDLLLGVDANGNPLPPPGEEPDEEGAEGPGKPDEQVAEDDEEEGQKPAKSPGKSNRQLRLERRLANRYREQNKRPQKPLGMRRKQFAGLWNKSHSRAEQRFGAALAKYFQQQASAVVKNLAHDYSPLKSPTRLAREIFDAEQWTAQLKKLAREHLQLITAWGAKIELDRFPESQPAESEPKSSTPRTKSVLIDIPENVMQAVDEFTAQAMSQPYWHDIATVTRSRIAEKLTAGIEKGAPLDFPAHWDPKLRIPRGQVVAAASIVSPKY